MQSKNIVGRLIDLQDQANVHTSEYQRFQHMPGHKTQATAHMRKALKLRAQIQKLIHQIASTRPAETPYTFESPKS